MCLYSADQDQLYFAETIGTMEQAFQFAQIILSRGIVIKVLSQEILWKYKSELRCELKTFKIQLHNIKDSRFLGCSAKLSNWQKWLSFQTRHSGTWAKRSKLAHSRGCSGQFKKILSKLEGRKFFSPPWGFQQIYL